MRHLHRPRRRLPHPRCSVRRSRCRWAAAPLTEPAADASADDITSELFERMSAILEQTESIRHTEQNSLSPAVSQRISRIEEECAEVIQLLVTLSDRENAPV